MKTFFKKILLYIILGVVIYAGSIVALTYFNDKTFGFNPKYLTNMLPIFAVFILLGLLLVKDLMNVVDGKGKKKKDKKEEKIEELTDRLTRQMAEFDNFRKRTDREKSQMYEIGAKDVIEKILPIVDNFERGLATVPEEEKGSPFAEGMEKIYKQLMTTLEGIGVKPIEAVGQEFNPDFHNAVMHVEDEELGENVIAEEFQKGYMYRDSVVRHSMVKVAN